MTLINRLLLCCVVAIPASAVYNGWATNSGWFAFNTVAALSFLAVAVACVLLAGMGGSTGVATAGKPARAAKPSKKKAKGGRQQGEVKWFNGGKGFGFISCDDGQELFVHFRSVRKDSPRLVPGKRVEFAIVEGKKGAEADDVQVI